MQETTRWKKRPPGSNWGDFGKDDQAGRLNLITPEKVLQGIARLGNRQEQQHTTVCMEPT